MDHAQLYFGIMIGIGIIAYSVHASYLRNKGGSEIVGNVLFYYLLLIGTEGVAFGLSWIGKEVYPVVLWLNQALFAPFVALYHFVF